MTSRLLVVGLGNPGPLARTRHSAGALFVTLLSELLSAPLAPRPSSHYSLSTIDLADRRTLSLLTCMTAMNVHGPPVKHAADRLNVRDPKSILLVHDDLDLPAGRARWKNGGSAGGHNGVKSINGSIGSEASLRLKIGIGRPAGAELDVTQWVLGRFKDDEWGLLEQAFRAGLGMIESQWKLDLARQHPNVRAFLEQPIKAR